MSLLAERFAVLDFETNGLSAAARGEVIETGVVHVDAGLPAATFEALTRSHRPIPAHATAIHGITEARVAGCPLFAEILRELLDFLGDRIVVAHNARFDRSFLDAATVAAGRGTLANPFLDTVRLSRQLCPELDRHDLETLCVHHRIPREARHRALPDAKATAELLRILLELAVERGLGTVDDVLELGRCRRTAPGRPRRFSLDETEQGLLEEAALTGDRLEIRYETATGRTVPALVVPYHVAGSRRKARLVAYDLDLDRTRMFPLDRVVAVRPLAGLH